MTQRLLFLLHVLAFSCMFPSGAKAQFSYPDTTISLNLLGHWVNYELPTMGTQRYNDVWGWVSPDGREYAIIGSIDSIYFFDITDPRNPVMADVKAGNARYCSHRDFKTHLHYAYAVADQGASTLQIFDLSYLPDSVHKVYDSDEFTQRTHNIHINNGKLYLADNKMESGQKFPMTVLSLDNPEQPTFLSHLIAPQVGGRPLFTHVHDVFVRNDTAWCSNGNDGLFIYDFTTPTSPKLINSIVNYPFKGYNHSSWMTDDGNYIVFADENHSLPLKLFDVSDVHNPRYKSILGLNAHKGSIPHNPFIKDNVVYIAYYHEGVVVFDITNKNNPKVIAQYDTYPGNLNYQGYEGCWGVYPFFPSGTIAASDMTHGLFLFSLDTTIITAPEVPQLRAGPNPVIDYMNFRLDVEKPTMLNFYLYDITGKMITTYRKELITGPNEWKLPFHPHLPNGVYIMRIIGEDFSQTHKILKRTVN